MSEAVVINLSPQYIFDIIAVAEIDDTRCSKTLSASLSYESYIVWYSLPFINNNSNLIDIGYMSIPSK